MVSMVEIRHREVPEAVPQRPTSWKLSVELTKTRGVQPVSDGAGVGARDVASVLVGYLGLVLKTQHCFKRVFGIQPSQGGAEQMWPIDTRLGKAAASIWRERSGQE